jgi:hypothetical protein
MATQETAQGPAFTGVDFEVERFGWTSGDRLEVTGRWFGVRGRRFVRPVLNVQLPGGRRRLIALLEHKPWAPHEGEAWIAAFSWEGEQAGVEAVELEVGPSLVVELPVPSGGTVSRPARAPTAPRVAARSVGAREELEALRTEAERLREEVRDAARLRAELSVASERIERLEAEVRSARSQPAPPPEPDPAVVAERDAALAARDAAHTARDEALAERDEALATPAEELAAARAERDEALARAEAAERGRGSLVSERDDAVARAEAAERTREALAFERDQALATRDAAVAERDAASAERDAAVRARDNARNRARRAGVANLGEVPPATQRTAPAPADEATPPPAEPPQPATPQPTTQQPATPRATTPPTPEAATPDRTTPLRAAPDLAAPEPAAPLPTRTRAQAPANPIFGPAEPLSRRRSSVARLIALLVLAAVVIALLVVLRGVL